MKKLFAITMLLISCAVVAQGHHKGGRLEKKEHMHMMDDFTPEQIAELKTKKMTLALDLSKNQQEKIYALNLTEAKERKKKREEHKAKIDTLKKEQKEKHERSAEERFNKMNDRLDKQIAIKKEMKSILTEDQYKKWETQRKKHHRRKSRQHRE